MENHEETNYLLNDPVNKNRLMQAVKNVKDGKVVEVNLDAVVNKLTDELCLTEDEEDQVLLLLMNDGRKERRMSEEEQADFWKWLFVDRKIRPDNPTNCTSNQ